MDRWDILRAVDEQRKLQALAALRLGKAITEAQALADRYEDSPPFGFTSKSYEGLRQAAGYYEAIAREAIEADLGDTSRVESCAEILEAEIAGCQPLSLTEEASLRQALQQ